MPPKIPLWPARGLARPTSRQSLSTAIWPIISPHTSPNALQRSSVLQKNSVSSYRPLTVLREPHVTTKHGTTTRPSLLSNSAFSQRFFLPPHNRFQNSIQTCLYSTKDGNSKPKVTETKKPEANAAKAQSATQNTASPPPGTEAEPESLASSVSKYLHLPHRPTKEELLAAATGFWQRLRVRFKWASIRSMRPWNADEWGAFVSWFMLGHIVWILVGTTTFFSLLIFSINTVFAQGTLLAALDCEPD